MTLRIYLRDRDNRRQGEIDDFQAFSYTRKWRGVGSFTLSMPTSAPIARFLVPRAGIIAVEDDEVVFSGPFTGLETVREQDSETLEVNGTDDNVLLRDRFAAPGLPPYNQLGHYSRVGPAENVIKAIVAFNLAQGWIADFYAPDALASRKGPVELATVEGRGVEIIGSVRFQQLDEAVSELCLVAGDWGWSVRQGVEGYAQTQLIFDTHYQRNVADSIRFSMPLGTLATYSYRIDRPEANYVVVAGQGELTAREFVYDGDDASIEEWGLIEGPMRDRRDAETTAELEQTLGEELATQGQKTAVGFQVSDTEAVAYGKTWHLGDVVTVEINDVEMHELVREVTVDYTPGSPREVSVLVGSPDVLHPEVPLFFAAQRNALSRATALERRK